jgi:transposase InsO family protein
MQYIIVATEYLIKRAETKAVKSTNAKQTIIFLYQNIISQFGCPKILISDRSSHFLNDAIVDLTELFNINHRKTTPYHPQTNGLIERVNQTLVRILRKIVIDSKQNWDHKLTGALWAYRTTYKVSTCTTPFSLVFGVEAILPMEFEVPSLRIAIDEWLDDSQSLKDRLERLKGLSEAWRLAAQHVEIAQR